MKMLQNVGRFAALEVVITESVLRCVTGDGLESDNEPDATYAWIGAGIGLFLAICFLASMLYMMKKHMLDSNLEDDMRRPSIRTVDMKFEYKRTLSEDTC